MSVRTFELAPIVSALPTSHAESKVQCMSQDNGGHLWIGLSDGSLDEHFHLNFECLTRWILRYQVTEETLAAGRSVYHSVLLSSKRIASKKAVTDVKVVDGLNRVICLCDGHLGMLDTTTAEMINGGAAKMKNVVSFSLNDRIDPEDPFISYEMCVVKKKLLQVVVLTDNQLTTLAEIALHETPLSLVFSDPYVCFASTSQYHIVNVKEASPQVHHLFPYPEVPVVASLTDSEAHEFLLAGPGGLGMFVSGATLVSPRPPINWAELRVTLMQYSSPYILVYSPDDIWVYSTINQQPKQSVLFDGCRAVCQSHFHSDRLTPLMALSSQVWALDTVPWQEQVEALLEDKRVEEALQIARSYLEEDLAQDYFPQILQRAALIQLHRHELTTAKELLLESQSSPYYIISYCLDLLPSVGASLGQLSPPSPPPPPFAIDLFNSDKSSVTRERNEFLLGYLEDYRRLSLDWPLNMNMVVLKLMIQLERYSAVLSLIKSFQNHLPYGPTKEVLRDNGLWVALVYFELRSGNAMEALSLLRSLLDQVVLDAIHGESVNLSTLVHILQSTDDRLAILHTLPWLLKKDDQLALDVMKGFDMESEDSNIKNMLVDYPDVRQAYLEVAVFQRNRQNHDMHLELIGIYLSRVAQLHHDATDFTGGSRLIRSKLQSALRSHLLTVTDQNDLMRVINDMELYQEKVILLAKKGEHLAALDLLAHRLKDRVASVDYCVEYGKDDKALKRLMFEHLLAIYFNPREQNQESVQAALQLLNDEAADFDVSKVLSILPANWPVECLDNFLTHTLRRTLHQQRTRAIECSLSKSLFFATHLTTMTKWKQKIVLTEEGRCVVCKKRFSSSSFKYLSDGRLSHISCHSSKQ